MMTRQRRSKKPRRLTVQGLEERRLLAVVFSPQAEEGEGAADASASAMMGPLSVEEGTDLPFDIRFNFGPAIRQVPSALQTMELAAQVWESTIADPVTVFIDMDFASLGDGTLGQASIETGLVDYPTLRELLIEDAVDEFVVGTDGVASLPDRSGRTDASPPIDDLDDRIVQYLPENDQLRFNLQPGTTFLQQGIDNPVSGNVNVPINGAASSSGLLSVNRATLKALGTLTPDDPTYLEPDGRIELTNQLVTLDSGESSFALDFDDDGVLSSSQFDGLAVAIHEIGHVLGFISSVDFFGATIAPTPMDLFRFPEGLDLFNPQVDPDPDAVNPFEQFQTFTRELRPNVQAMTDFGNEYWTDTENPAVEVPMADVFSGQQTSHWREFGVTPDSGIMGPTLSAGISESLTSIDLRMFDLIGWDIVSPALTDVDISNLYVDPVDGSTTDPRANAYDVDGNGTVSALDALLVINDLNRLDAQGESEDLSTDSQVAATDVNQDGVVTAIDALAIINYLNEQTLKANLVAVDDVFSESDEFDVTWIDGPTLALF
ncbi:MAG: NF038122 family metalloprotease [Planctomycetota bacterium]